ncbi:MAG: Grx4 family monothiol glutaredoxin [Proteobacteria bacterium]|nr:Grx4 family monothiol glutaredoxin [Pseudomonadota bacterium]
MALDEALRARIQDLVEKNRIVLFMKGSRHMPMCGFSGSVVQVLDELASEYTTINVLSDPALREGVKEFSQWPTIPQLYIEGKFVGGRDIVVEMHAAGELHEMLGLDPPQGQVPSISLSASAVEAVRRAAEGQQGDLRLEISNDFQYALSIDEPQPSDLRVQASGVTVLLDRGAAQCADGLRIDYVSGQNEGFRIDNPNEPRQVVQLAPRDLKEMMDGREPFRLLDARTPEEQAKASLSGATLLDDASLEGIEALDRDTPLVVYCHHGGRSQRAAEYLLSQGFRSVYNLAGGIDAWSRQVDPAVPRY